MRYIPADDAAGLLERYEVADSDLLGLANEHGDVTAYVTRTDGTRGHAFGGPVYDWDGFQNVCEGPRRPWERKPFRCSHEHDLTDAEKATAAALGRRVGWCT